MEIFNVQVNSTLNPIDWSTEVTISNEIKELQQLVNQKQYSFIM